MLCEKHRRNNVYLFGIIFPVVQGKKKKINPLCYLTPLTNLKFYLKIENQENINRGKLFYPPQVYTDHEAVVVIKKICSPSYINHICLQGSETYHYLVV